MVTIHIKGRITADGLLQFEPPRNLPPGEVEITLQIPEGNESFTDEEIKDLLTFTPTSGADVVAAGLVGGWEHKGITDSVAFVEELRRKQREQRSW